MATEALAAPALNTGGRHPQSFDPAPYWPLPLVAAAHAALFAVLASLEDLPLPNPLATLMVRVIVPTAPAMEITPPRPTPVERKPVPQPLPSAVSQPQMLAAPMEIPVPATAPITKEAPSPSPPPAAPKEGLNKS